ncbi:MAG: putative sugar nucleotidyl transferase [Planctomycetaceae bacterium]|nr:putative sugar nucleotidyl transferase [Planctomycetaceae bacterium]
MRIAFFEDDKTDQFTPIALLRPVCELLCGHFTARERALRFLPVTEWGLYCRDHLIESYAAEHPEAHLNDFAWLSAEPTLLLNSRWLCDPRELSQCDRDAVGLMEGEVAWITLDPLETALVIGQDLPTAIGQIARTRRRVKATGKLAQYPWDLVAHNGEQIAWDFAARSAQREPARHAHLAIVGDPTLVSIDEFAEIDPYVVLDTRQGPIFIDGGAVVQAFTRIEGPAFIGRQTQLFRTNLRAGSSIGPVCRVGGEIEASILHGYVNKYHDGFLGHAYVSPWCNLGALTTNSDLKNDYSTVRVPLAGEAIESGQMKVGCFLGDHTKTAIGSCFNTGTSIGVMCQVLPAGELLPKHIPSFTRVWHGELVDGFPMDRNLATARAAMNRRGVELTDAQERLLRHVFHDTAAERRRAFERQESGMLSVVQPSA